MYELLMGASIGLGAYSQYQAGLAQSTQLLAQRREVLANEQRARADAALSERIGEMTGVEMAFEAAQAEGTQRVIQAAGGGRTDVGTNFLLRLQTSAWNEWKVFQEALVSTQRTNRLIDEALGHTRQAKVLKSAAKTARTTGRLGAVTTILGGLGTMGAMGMFDKPGTIGGTTWGRVKTEMAKPGYYSGNP